MAKPKTKIEFNQVLLLGFHFCNLTLLKRLKFTFLITLMPFHRNFTYYIDKRSWKYYFLMLALSEGH